MDKVHNILLNKLKADKLSHLVIFQGGASHIETNLDIKNYLHRLTKEYFKDSQPNEISNIINHPDFLEIDIPTEAGNYTLEDIAPIYKFLNYKAAYAPSKVIIIGSAHKLNEKICNNLLKVLEEPPVDCHIFLINESGKKLLKTIESRAIKISLNLKTELKTQDYSAILKSITYTDFSEKLKKHKKEETNNIIIEALNKKVKNIQSVHEASELLNSLKKIEKFEDLNIYGGTKDFKIFTNLIKEK